MNLAAIDQDLRPLRKRLSLQLQLGSYLRTFEHRLRHHQAHLRRTNILLAAEKSDINKIKASPVRSRIRDLMYDGDLKLERETKEWKIVLAERQTYQMMVQEIKAQIEDLLERELLIGKPSRSGMDLLAAKHFQVLSHQDFKDYREMVAAEEKERDRLFALHQLMEHTETLIKSLRELVQSYENPSVAERFRRQSDFGKQLQALIQQTQDSPLSTHLPAVPRAWLDYKFDSSFHTDRAKRIEHYAAIDDALHIMYHHQEALFAAISEQIDYIESERDQYLLVCTD
ncbi:MAG: hypothetical protein AAFP02_00485 [Bacteroidota bacterium]